MDQLGRKVTKGQKGIRILAPMIGTRKKKDNEADRSKDLAAINAPILVGFRAVYVFVSQTEGAELPDLKERVKGEVGEYPLSTVPLPTTGAARPTTPLTTLPERSPRCLCLPSTCMKLTTPAVLLATPTTQNSIAYSHGISRKRAFASGQVPQLDQSVCAR